MWAGKMAHRRAGSKYLFPSPSVVSGEEEELKREDFAFERKLGDGAFGQVWKARHLASGRIYAIKQVPKQNVLSMLPQFKREVVIMYELSHPFVIKLHNHFEDERCFYLILELAEGGTLFSKIFKEKQIMEPVAAQIFWEVATAVEYLHSHVPAIIHRDLKPENVLLDRQGRVKLTDFGWSNYFNQDVGVPRTTICGTLEYLPPEIVEETGHGPGMDIWCLGVLLYEMLIGSTPFKAGAKAKVLSK